MILVAFGQCLGGLIRGGAGEFYRPFCEEIHLAGENFRGDARAILVMFLRRNPP